MLTTVAFCSCINSELEGTWHCDSILHKLEFAGNHVIITDAIGITTNYTFTKKGNQILLSNGEVLKQKNPVLINYSMFMPRYYTTLRCNCIKSSLSIEDRLLGVVTSSVLNVRKDASTSGKILGQLKKDDKVLIVGYTNSWYQINQGETIGWVSRKYIDLL